MTSFPRRLLMLPLLALGACTMAPPSHLALVSLPGPDKSFRQFQSDDAMCQTHASSATSDALGGAAAAGDKAQGTANSLQGRFDTAYAQCMVGNGETIEPPSGPASEAAPVVYAPASAVIVGPGY